MTQNHETQTHRHGIAKFIEYILDTPYAKFLNLSTQSHSHLCPRQVLGVRLAIAGALSLYLETPSADKRLLVIAETDGCYLDGLSAPLGVSVGHRTLRIEDYGKIAAAFIDTQTGAANRVAPRLNIRELACEYAPEEPRRYFAMILGYQRIPDQDLLSITPIELTTPVENIISRPSIRTACTKCGEEIINEREIIQDGKPYCRTCAVGGYYRIK